MEQTINLGVALRNAWLVPAIPLASFFIVGLLVRQRRARLAGVMGTLAVFASAAWAWMIAW